VACLSLHGDPAIAQFTDQRIDESSGLAASQYHRERFWTHNDSGDEARLFLLDRVAGQARAVPVTNAKAVDWEDMASGRVGERRLLVIADIGDNARRRDSVQLYLIDEPSESEKQCAAESIDVRYPDGPRDGEAVAIDAAGGRILIIAKGLLPLAGVYAVPIPDKPTGHDLADSRLDQSRITTQPTASVVASQIATLPISMVTGMDIRDDQLQMAVITYRDLFLFDRTAQQSWEAALRETPTHHVLPKLKQIEAVCYDREGNLWVTSEGSPMPLVQVAITAPSDQPISD
jgi:hypothetical protein